MCPHSGVTLEPEGRDSVSNFFFKDKLYFLEQF